MKISKTSNSTMQKLLLWSAGSINLIILLLLLSIWRAGDRAFNFIGHLLKYQPAQLQLDNSTPVLQRIQNIQELSTTVQTVETIVPASAERKLGDISLGTTRLLYIARGEVRAGIDLSELTEADIVVDGDRIEINLPQVKILDSKIDVNHSRVYDYDRGFLNLGPDVAPQLQTLAQRKTLVKIVDTACNEGILNSANTKAKEAITWLLTNANYQQVTVNIATDSNCSLAPSSEI